MALARTSGMAAFTGLTAPSSAVAECGSHCARHASGTPQKPWKPLVFKMPKTKPPRVIGPDDDAENFEYTMRMRERLKGVRVEDDKDYGEERSVSETKVSDLINKEADDAKIAGLNTMYYLDRDADRRKFDKDNPDTQVLRSKYEAAMDKLNRVEHKEEAINIKGTLNEGYLEIAKVQDIDEVFANARAKPVKKQRVATTGEDEEEGEEDDEGIADFLWAVQKQSAMQDKVSKRVMKSPAQRKEDYEETKDNLVLATALLGVVGAIVSFFMYGVSTAFSFGMGSFGALYYLSGLSAYADAAETPMGQVMGGRRLVVPVILVLFTVQWEKVCYYAPALGGLGVTPELLPVLMGFFTYVIGKVTSSLIPTKRSQTTKEGKEAVEEEGK